MTTTPQRPPLSVLDLAIVTRGGTSAAALAETTALAQRAEALGYRRFWVVDAARWAMSTGGEVLATDGMLWCSATQNRR